MYFGLTVIVVVNCSHFTNAQVLPSWTTYLSSLLSPQHIASFDSNLTKTESLCLEYTNCLFSALAINHETHFRLSLFCFNQTRGLARSNNFVEIFCFLKQEGF